MNDEIKNRFAKSPEEIEGLRHAASIVSGVHAEMKRLVKPGAVTRELDNRAEEFIRDHDAEPAFKGYQMTGSEDPYPTSLCISVNDTVVHGFPSENALVEGDIVSVDVGVLANGFYGDCAATYPVGEISPDDQRLIDITVESLYLGIEQAVAGNWVFDIAREVQQHAESNGFSVVRELVGHGIGRELHEEPAVPNFVPNPFSRHRYRNQKLVEGMVICIEPMINAGSWKVFTADNGWEVRTSDHSRSAHAEHMVVVGADEPEILTTHLAVPSGVSA